MIRTIIILIKIERKKKREKREGEIKMYIDIYSLGTGE